MAVFVVNILIGLVLQKVAAVLWIAKLSRFQTLQDK